MIRIFLSFLVFPLGSIATIGRTDRDAAVLLAVDVPPLTGFDAYSSRVSQLEEKWHWILGVRTESIIVEVEELAILPWKKLVNHMTLWSDYHFSQHRLPYL